MLAQRNLRCGFISGDTIRSDLVPVAQGPDFRKQAPEDRANLRLPERVCYNGITVIIR
jgi:hypothetical protein